MIRLQDVSFSIQGKPLLSSINASLPPNQLTIMVGPNGAGKSTLLNVMAGGLPATNGKVSMKGLDITQMDRSNLARLRAVLSQGVELPFPLTVSEVVALGRTQNSEKTADLYEIIQGALGYASATSLINRNVNSLSGGERQRVHFARVIAQLWDAIHTQSPAMLLLDEPTSAMDMLYQHKLLSQLKDLVKQGLTICCILHDLNLAAMFADHIWVLKAGRLVANGKTSEVFKGSTLSHIYEAPLMTIPHPQQPHQRVVIYSSS